MAKKEPDISYGSEVVCILNFKALIDLGKILCIAQKNGYVLTGMETIRISKTQINDMFSTNIYNQDYYQIRTKAIKLFCNGPAIALSLYRARDSMTLAMALGIY